MAYRASGRSNRSGRSQIDHDVFEGLPVRHWRRQPVTVGIAPKLEPVAKNRTLQPELPMPKEANLLSPMSRALLQAARAGTADRNSSKDAPAEKEALEDDKQGDGASGFLLRRWTLVPKNSEGPEPEYLAKRRKGLPSIYGAGNEVVSNGHAKRSTPSTPVRRPEPHASHHPSHLAVVETATPPVAAAPEPQTVEEVAPADAPSVTAAVDTPAITPAEAAAAPTESAEATPPEASTPTKRKAEGISGGKRKKKRVQFSGGLDGMADGDTEMGDDSLQDGEEDEDEEMEDVTGSEERAVGAEGAPKEPIAISGHAEPSDTGLQQSLLSEPAAPEADTSVKTEEEPLKASPPPLVTEGVEPTAATEANLAQDSVEQATTVDEGAKATPLETTQEQLGEAPSVITDLPPAAPASESPTKTDLSAEQQPTIPTGAPEIDTGTEAQPEVAAEAPVSEMPESTTAAGSEEAEVKTEEGPTESLDQAPEPEPSVAEIKAPDAEHFSETTSAEPVQETPAVSSEEHMVPPEEVAADASLPATTDEPAQETSDEVPIQPAVQEEPISQAEAGVTNEAEVDLLGSLEKHLAGSVGAGQPESEEKAEEGSKVETETEKVAEDQAAEQPAEAKQDGPEDASGPTEEAAVKTAE